MTEETPTRPERPDAIADPRQVQEGILEPAKVLRIASMTRALLGEVRAVALDEQGRRRLQQVYQRSLDELREVLSEDLREELDEIFLPLSDESASQGELQVAQAQLIGWLEGLFHGIQATLWSQQMAARAQLEEMRRRALPTGDEPGGAYL